MKNRGIVCLSEPNPIPIGGRKSVTPQHVLMLVADINYTTVYLFNGDQFMIATTLGKVQRSLDPHGNFVRLNRKCTVNWILCPQVLCKGAEARKQPNHSFLQKKRQDNHGNNDQVNQP